MTTPKQYFTALLDSQNLTSESDEIKELEAQKIIVTDILEREFWSSLTIKYAWSYSKNTMIKELYDLDIIAYFSEWEDRTLEEIFFAINDALKDRFQVKQKTSAIYLAYDKEDEKIVHIDVVPWRFIEWSSGDAYIYQKESEKCRLKTNLDIHIDHIRTSKEHATIRIIKLLKVINGFEIKTFFLELFVIEALKDSLKTHIEEKIMEVFQYIVDNIETIQLIDPANTNNIISDQVTLSEKKRMKKIAQDLISQRDNLIGDDEIVKFWETVFWEVAIEKVYSAPTIISNTPKPWVSY